MRRLSPLFGLVLLAAAAVAQPAGDLIQPTDLFEIRELGSVTVSPDGRSAVYTVREIVEDTARAGRNTYRTHLWLAPLDGRGEPRPLTSGSESAAQPAWHPEGDRIAFVRAHEGRSQVFVLPLAGGDPTPVTALPHGANSPQFAPDGRSLLVASSLPWHVVDSLMADVPPWASERPARPYRDLAAGPEADPDGGAQAVRAFLDQRRPAIVQPIVRLNFQGEHTLEPDPSFRHLYAVPLAEGDRQQEAEARPLTHGFVGTSGGAWTPDGAEVVLALPADTTIHPDRNLGSHLYRVSAEGGRPQLLLSMDGWSLSQPLPSPDGRHVAFIGTRLAERGFQEGQVGLLDRQSGTVRWLTEAFDRSAGQLAFGPDGEHVYFVAAANGDFPLYRIAVDAEMPLLERLTGPEAGVRSYDVGAEGIAFVQTTIENPYELLAVDADGFEARTLTRHNADWLAGKRVSRPDARTLMRSIPREGRPDTTFAMEYWVMEPTDRQPGETYPLLLQIHGGPSAMWGPGEASMWHEFQMLAARGFGIVYSNPRGSGGYGYDFRRANFRDWGHGPTSDVLAALESAVAAEDWVDPDRLVVAGGSYAGYLTAWIVAHDHRFQAAVAQRGVYDLATFLGEGNAWRLVPTHFGGFPWEDEARDVLRANSPMTFVDQIETPLLIIHASQDLRTGVIQSEMLYRSLKLLERPVEYVRYPGGGHDLSRTGDPDQRLDRLLRIYEFLDRHVH